MTRNSQLSTEPKKQKQKLNKQLEQEQNKPGSERQIPYDLIYKWNIITKTNKQAKYNC